MYIDQVQGTVCILYESYRKEITHTFQEFTV